MNLMDPDTLRAHLVQYGIPESAHEGLIRYFVDRIQPGHFLMAVLINDLAEACGRGDVENIAALRGYVMFLVNAAPGHAWGSRALVTEWLMETPREPEYGAGLHEERRQRAQAETPRELTEQEMQTLEERARYFNREITVALDAVLSLCHMARRGARFREALEQISHAPESNNLLPRRIARAALKHGAGEETT